MRDHGRTVDAVEAWVRRGIAEGWCKPVPSFDVPGRFRRRFAADLSMGCESPVNVEVFGRWDRRCKAATGIFVDVATRCRKCQVCLNNKARYWTARAYDEYNASSSTWLMTLTLRPEMHYFFDARMQLPYSRGKKLLRDSVGPLDGLAPATLFALRAREIGYEITDMLKRMRKSLGPFRYLQVAERHVGNPSSEVFGRPHFHMLIHTGSTALIKPHEWQDHAGPCEAACKHPTGRPIWHRAGAVHDAAKIRSFWSHGFNDVVRCMDHRSAVYVCKYVSKDPMARVRASLGYGKIGMNANEYTRQEWREAVEVEKLDPKVSNSLRLSVVD